MLKWGLALLLLAVAALIADKTGYGYQFVSAEVLSVLFWIFLIVGLLLSMGGIARSGQPSR